MREIRVKVVVSDPTPKQIERYRAKIRKLSNSARYEEAHQLARRMMELHPNMILFAYQEAVYGAEGEIGYSKAEIRSRHKRAAAKLKRLLRRMRSADELVKSAIRNEYYWFSHQPYKQYRLGCELVANGMKRRCYSQGVGAAELAKRYGLAGNRALCLRWAKRSERAWLNYFKIVPDWYNSHFFYAMALGYQGRVDEMERALKKACTIAGKTMRWPAIKVLRSEIHEVAAKVGHLNSTAKTR